MLKKIFFGFFVCALAANFIGCVADIPELTTEASAEGYAKTADYPLVSGNLSPVNPNGLIVSPAVENSNGVVSMELSGTVPCGIPPALQEIIDDDKIKVQTDFPYHHTNWEKPADDLYYYTDNPSDYTKGNHDKPLENMISLKALSKNSHYAAVTISFPNIGSGIKVEETNDSLMLLANNYCTNNGANATYSFNADNMAWRRTTNYTATTNPNYFAYYSGYDSSGVSNQIEYSIPGPGSYNLDRGGMSFLIWKGGQQNAAVIVNNQTVKFDWSRLNFKSEPLIYGAWYPLPPPPTIISISLDETQTAPPNGNNPLPDFHYIVTVPIGSASTGAWVDNFITPSFYPENSTEKGVALVTESIPTTPVEEGDSYIKVSLADRIRLEFYNVAANPTEYPDTQIATIYTSNTDDYFKQINLYLKVIVNE